MPEEESPVGSVVARHGPILTPKNWLDAMASRGWTAPTWPRQYGGGGLSKDEARILSQELGRLKARPALDELWHLDAGARPSRICQ